MSMEDSVVAGDINITQNLSETTKCPLCNSSNSEITTCFKCDNISHCSSCLEKTNNEYQQWQIEKGLVEKSLQEELGKRAFEILGGSSESSGCHECVTTISEQLIPELLEDADHCSACNQPYIGELWSDRFDAMSGETHERNDSTTIRQREVGSWVAHKCAVDKIIEALINLNSYLNHKSHHNRRPYMLIKNKMNSEEYCLKPLSWQFKEWKSDGSLNKSLVKFSICLPNEVGGDGNSLQRLSTNFYDASISILKLIFQDNLNYMSVGYDEISYKLKYMRPRWMS